MEKEIMGVVRIVHHYLDDEGGVWEMVQAQLGYDPYERACDCPFWFIHTAIGGKDRIYPVPQKGHGDNGDWAVKLVATATGAETAALVDIDQVRFLVDHEIIDRLSWLSEEGEGK